MNANLEQERVFTEKKSRLVIVGGEVVAKIFDILCFCSPMTCEEIPPLGQIFGPKRGRINFGS